MVPAQGLQERTRTWQICVYVIVKRSFCFQQGVFHHCHGAISTVTASRVLTMPRITAKGAGWERKVNNFLLLPYALNPFSSLPRAKVRIFFPLAIFMVFQKSQISKAKPRK